MARSLGDAVIRIRTDLSNALKGLRTLGQNVRQVGQGVRSAGMTMALGGVAVTGVFKNIIEEGMNFERRMSAVKARMEPTAEQFKKLAEKAKQLGESTKWTATETASAMEVFGHAGIKFQDTMDGVHSALNLAQIGEMKLAETTSIITKTLSQFKKKGKDVTDFVDVFAVTVNNSNTDVREMGEALQYSGTLAHSMHKSFKEVATAIGVLGDSGITASRAGTGLTRLFSRLVGGAKPVRDALKVLGLRMSDIDPKANSLRDVLVKLNQSGKGAFGAFNALADKGIDVEKMFHDMQKENLTAAETMEAIQETARRAGINLGKFAQLGPNIAAIWKLFGQRGGAAALVLSSNIDKFDELAAKIDKSAGAGQKMADIMIDNVWGSLKILVSRITGIKIKIFEAMAERLQAFIEVLTSKVFAAISKWVSKHKELTKTIAVWVSGLGAAAAIIGSVTMVVGMFIASLGFIIEAVALLAGMFTWWLIPLAMGLTVIAGLAWLLVKRLWKMRDAIADALGLNKSLGDWKETLLGVWKTVKGLARAFDKFLEDTLTKVLKFIEGADFHTLVDRVKQTITNMWQAIKRGFNLLRKIAIPAFSEIKKALEPVVAIIWKDLVVAFNLVVGVIKRIQKIWHNVFGNPDTINTISIAIKQVAGAIGEIIQFIMLRGGQAFKQLTAFTMGFISGFLDAWPSIKDSVLATIQAFGNAWEQVKHLFAALGDLMGLKSESSNWVDIISTIGVVLGKVVSGILIIIQLAAATIGHLTTIIIWIEATIVEALTGIRAAFGWLMNGLETLVAYWIVGWGRILSAVKSALTFVFNLWLKSGKLFSSVVIRITSLLGSTLSWIVNAVATGRTIVYNTVAGFFKLIYNTVVDKLSNLLLILGNSISKIWGFIANGFRAWYKAVKTFLVGIISSVIGFVARIIFQVVVFFTDLVKKAKLELALIILTVAQWFARTYQKIRDGMLNIVKIITDKVMETKQLGIDFVQGFLDGVKAKWDAVVEFFRGGIKHVASFFDFTERHSPSVEDIFKNSFNRLAVVAQLGTESIASGIQANQTGSAGTIGGAVLGAGQNDVLTDNRTLNMNVKTSLDEQEMMRVISDRFLRSAMTEGAV